MNYSVVIPAYNEEKFLSLTLDSITAQTVRPKQVVIVDDNSADRTLEIARSYAAQHHYISVISNTSENKHLPGAKVIRAFQKGFEELQQDFDVIMKLDADLILPTNYFEEILKAYQSDDKTGMAGGFAYIEKNGVWILENFTDKDHIRGALKSYRRECFEQIGGLRAAMGWDTVDELLARFYGWNVVTLPQLRVRHLKPTGSGYDKAARYKQGEAFYTLGYGFLITSIASAKLAMMKKKPQLFVDYINGYFKAKRANAHMLVTPEQARFIRRYRMQKMLSKIF